MCAWSFGPLGAPEKSVSDILPAALPVGEMPCASHWSTICCGSVNVFCAPRMSVMKTTARPASMCLCARGASAREAEGEHLSSESGRTIELFEERRGRAEVSERSARIVEREVGALWQWLHGGRRRGQQAGSLGRSSTRSSASSRKCTHKIQAPGLYACHAMLFA